MASCRSPTISSRVRERIARAAESAGRSADEITLVGVTKYVGAQRSRRTRRRRLPDLGESRPQELWKKAEALSSEPRVRPRPRSAGTSSATSNATKSAARSRSSRSSTASTANAFSPRSTKRMQSPSRGDDAATAHQRIIRSEHIRRSRQARPRADAVEPLLAAAPQYPHVAIRGLMTMAALEGGEAVAARNFASLRELRDRLKPNAPPMRSTQRTLDGHERRFRSRHPRRRHNRPRRLATLGRNVRS